MRTNGIGGRVDFRGPFSARFQDRRHDEGRFIESVLRQVDLPGRSTWPEAEGLLRDLGALIWHQDEPFGSTGVFAQWKVYSLAREAGVNVCLDGQGAEQMGGFLEAKGEHLFEFLQGVCSGGIALEWFRTKSVRLRALALATYGLIPLLIPSRWGDRFERGVESAGAPWVGKGLKVSVRNGRRPEEWNHGSFLQRMCRHGFIDRLPTCLRFLDRNSMAHGISARLPFLDHRLVDLMNQAPITRRIRWADPKVVLRRALGGMLPETVRRRRDKVNFSTPEDQWLRGPVARLSREVFASGSFRSRPYFDSETVARIHDDHSAGRRDGSREIWRCLCLELWMRRFIDGF
jgi:asparagine synthase (glutamine-hydrolysing)